MVEEVINSRLAFFRFQALEPVFTPCTDQGCVFYVYKLSKCLFMVYGGIWVICTSALESTHTQRDYNLGLNETGSIFEVVETLFQM